MTQLTAMIHWVYGNPITLSLLAIAVMLVAGFISYLACIFCISRFIRKFIFHSHEKSALFDKDLRISRKVSQLVPVVVVYALSQMIPGLPPHLIELVHTACGVVLVFNISMLINVILDAFNSVHARKHVDRHHSIKGYIQIAKIIVSSLAVILAIATLSDKSPLIIISSLGAAAAVLMFIFQHTLISLVANVQISSSDVIRLGDWIEMPQNNISGEVTDIALHTITIQNWDNTVSRIPTKNFITEPYTNWQPMFESGGRRIKRSLLIDQDSIKFADSKMVSDINTLSRTRHVQFFEYLDSHPDEKLIEQGVTNLGLFRRFLVNYLRERDDIQHYMYTVVRQLSPTADGLPVEVYCFTAATGWESYEETQSEIFEYMYAIARYFSLKIYQRPSGQDIKTMAGRLPCQKMSDAET
ncbi:membrane protein [Salmonella enterica subsp. enterica serovar Choleraesuis]|nr:membrane protein [Salmonella enterica subsp. enterica serovar Choleraesuis]